MRFHTLLVATLALTAPLASLPETEAFTYGPYLPSYLCGPAIAFPNNGTIIGKDGTPKALAGVLKMFVEKTPASGDPYRGQQQDSRALVGAFHNANSNMGTTLFGDPANAAQLKPMTLTTNVINNTNNITMGAIPIVAQVNILNVGRIQALPVVAAADAANCLTPNTLIVPGGGVTAVTTTMTTNEVVTLTLQSKNNILGQPSGNVLNAADFGNSGTPAVLDGAILYAQDANNNRVGKFVATGPAMSVWAACGADNQGLVHNQLLSCTNTYSGPQFFLPWWFFSPLQKAAPAPQAITFMGAAVTDNGFGYHQTKWTVNAQTVAVDINALNKADVIKCATNTLPCFAACVQCVQKAGSTKQQAAKGANLACTPTTMFPTGPVNPQTQATIWTATCTVKGAATPVAPAGAVVIPPPKAADAVDNATTIADAIALDDVLSQLILTTNNGTSMDMDAMNAMNTNAASQCPSSTTQPNGNTNYVNSAISSTTVGAFTSLMVAVTALFGRQ